MNVATSAAVEANRLGLRAGQLDAGCLRWLPNGLEDRFLLPDMHRH